MPQQRVEMTTALGKASEVLSCKECKDREREREREREPSLAPGCSCDPEAMTPETIGIE